MANKLIEIPRHFETEEPDRKERIRDEITVDAHGDEEIITSWYYYLEETLAFPFTAMVLTHRSGNTTHTSKVKLLDMAPLSCCGYWQMWAMGTLSLDRETPLHFLLSDITQIEPEEERLSALTDWMYWTRHQRPEIWVG